MLEHEVNDFISKPCPQGELLEKIRTHLGLDYLHEDEPDLPETGTGAVRSVAISREQLKDLPRELAQQLHDATLHGDKVLLDGLIPQIEERGDARSARALQELADTYQYDRLMELLEEACRP